MKNNIVFCEDKLRIKLEKNGALFLSHAVFFEGIIINEFYLSSIEACVNYCSNYAFKNKNQEIIKRKVALKLATLLIQ